MSKPALSEETTTKISFISRFSFQNLLWLQLCYDCNFDTIFYGYVILCATWRFIFTFSSFMVEIHSFLLKNGTFTSLSHHLTHFKDTTFVFTSSFMIEMHSFFFLNRSFVSLRLLTPLKNTIFVCSHHLAPCQLLLNRPSTGVQGLSHLVLMGVIR